MGDRVTGVRVTPISGLLADRGAGLRGRYVSAGPGSTGGADVAGGGGGGGGAGGRLLVASSVDTGVVGAVVGAVSVTDVVASSTPPGLNTSRTAATTRAAAAVAAAINAISACFPRYHGAGAGSKYQVSESNASNAPSRTGSAAVTGSASVQNPQQARPNCPGRGVRRPVDSRTRLAAPVLVARRHRPTPRLPTELPPGRRSSSRTPPRLRVQPHTDAIPLTSTYVQRPNSGEDVSLAWPPR